MSAPLLALGVLSHELSRWKQPFFSARLTKVTSYICGATPNSATLPNPRPQLRMRITSPQMSTFCVGGATTRLPTSNWRSLQLSTVTSSTGWRAKHRLGTSRATHSTLRSSSGATRTGNASYTILLNCCDTLFSVWYRFGSGAVIYWMGFISELDCHRDQGIALLSTFPSKNSIQTIKDS